LIVANTTIRDNAITAIVVAAPTGSPRILVSIDGARLAGNSEGLSVTGGALVTISNSVIVNNTPAFGIVAQTPAGSAANTEVNVENCVISHNGFGVGVRTGSPIVRLSNTHITNNAVGVDLVSGTVQSFGNNRIAANGSGNAPSPGAGISLT
jgi:hypothetical protein